MHTELLGTGSAAARELAIRTAVALLARGEAVALPTETVYGLAADALNPLAVARIFEAKERPSFDPLICHLPDRAWLEQLAEVSPESRELVEQLTSRFWPGPLTLVLPKRKLVPDLVTSGLSKVALRLSGHPVFTAIVQKFGRPLAAPSANRFGRISPTSASHVAAELSGRIPLIVDGGPCAHGLESTIVAVEGETLRLLRPGPITRDELVLFAPVAELTAGAMPEAPGQLASHYAPRTPMNLLHSPDAPGNLPSGLRLGLLAWREPIIGEFAAIEVLSRSGDLREAAATLFAKMRRLDEQALDLILAQPVPEHGLGVAIMDRLSRASANRSPAERAARPSPPLRR